MKKRYKFFSILGLIIIISSVVSLAQITSARVYNNTSSSSSSDYFDDDGILSNTHVGTSRNYQEVSAIEEAIEKSVAVRTHSAGFNGNTFYIGNGTGSGAGSESDPYTVKQATDLMVAGTINGADTIVLKTGSNRYDETDGTRVFGETIFSGGYPLILPPTMSGTELKSDQPGVMAVIQFGRDLSSATWTQHSGNIYKTTLSDTNDRHESIIFWEQTTDIFPFGQKQYEVIASASLPAAGSFSAGRYWINNTTGDLYVYMNSATTPAGQNIWASQNNYDEYPSYVGSNSTHGVHFGKQPATSDSLNDVYIHDLAATGVGTINPTTGGLVGAWNIGGAVGGNTIIRNIYGFGGTVHTIGFIDITPDSKVLVDDLRAEQQYPGGATGTFVWNSVEGSDWIFRDTRIDYTMGTFNSTTATATAGSHTAWLSHSDEEGNSLTLINPRIGVPILNDTTQSSFGGALSINDQVATSMRVFGGHIYQVTFASNSAVNNFEFDGTTFYRALPEGTQRAGNEIVIRNCVDRHLYPTNVSTDLTGTWLIENCVIDATGNVGGSAGMYTAGSLADTNKVRLTFRNNIWIQASGGGPLFQQMRASNIVESNNNAFIFFGANNTIINQLDTNNDGVSNGAFTVTGNGAGTWTSTGGYDVNSLKNTAAVLLVSENNNYKPDPASTLIDAGRNVGLAKDFTGNFFITRNDIGPYEIDKGMALGNNLVQKSGNAGLITSLSGARINDIYGSYISLTASSTISGVKKYGQYITATSSWNGANYGLFVDTLTGGTSNYGGYFANSVGIGTSTPTAPLHVSAGTSATTTVNVGALGTATSKACFNVQNSAGTNISFYFVGTTQVVENNACR